MSKSEYARLTDYFPDVVKVIREQVLDEVVTAINNEPFDMSSTEFPYKREHQEEGLNIALDAIENLKNK